ncbi:MAG: hypothetical protein SWK90_01910 [Chloroflexota bacterium]|nr:hypothetical protein [Chloroflexota bacterium]
MDPATLAATAVTLLSPYLAEAGKTAAKKIGESVGDAVPKLYQAIKSRFAQQPAAAEALADLEKTPTDKDTQAAARVQLKKILTEDASFAEQLGQLLEAAQSAGDSTVVTVTGSGAAAVGDKATAIGEHGAYVGRDAHGPIRTGDA